MKINEKTNEKTLFEKLLKLQSLGITVEKNGTNPFFKSKYILLDDIITTYSGHLSDCGLVVYHYMTMIDGTNLLNTKVVNSLNPLQFIETSFPLPQANGPQAIASNITYAKRYNLGQLLNIAVDADDDANSASEIKTALTDGVIENIKNLISEGKYTKNEIECLADVKRKYTVSKDQENMIKAIYTKPIESLLEGFSQ